MLLEDKINQLNTYLNDNNFDDKESFDRILELRDWLIELNFRRSEDSNLNFLQLVPFDSDYVMYNPETSTTYPSKEVKYLYNRNLVKVVDREGNFIDPNSL